MRALLAAVLSLAAVTATAPPASPAATSGPGVAGGGITWVTTVPVDAGLATGARIVGNRLYVSGARAISIYDITDRLAPRLLSTTPIGVAFPNEDVDTNGRILLVNDEQLVSGELQVWDVRDGAKPARLSIMPNMRDHTYSCLFDCRYAYGSRGSVVDLRDPAKPRYAGSWGGLPRNDGYDVTEVRPGLAITASRTMRVLDTRASVTSPPTLATGTTPDNRLLHSVRWPRAGADRWLIVQGETPLTGRCDARSGAISVWDTRGWRTSKSLRMVSEYRVTNGTYADGRPPAGALGCTAMWFEHHPAFRDGGLVAAGYFEHGMRLLDVSRSGAISEVGYWMPAAGATIAAYWAAPDVVYALDAERGLDVLRVAPRE